MAGTMSVHTRSRKGTNGSSYQNRKSPKATTKGIAFQKDSGGSSQPECESIEGRLACFQFVGNIFKH